MRNGYLDFGISVFAYFEKITWFQMSKALRKMDVLSIYEKIYKSDLFFMAKWPISKKLVGVKCP